MALKEKLNFRSWVELWEWLPEDQRIITDVLRQIVSASLPSYCTEKLTNNVPYFFGKRRICLIWPGAVPGGGIKKGVLFGFSYGNRLPDKDHYLDHGTNKRIFYKIYHNPDEIDADAVIRLLKEAVEIDKNFK